MNKFLRTIVALSVLLSQLDVRVLHAQMITAYAPVMPVTLTAPVITNLPLVTPSVLEKEKILDLSGLSFSFSRTDFGSLSGPSNLFDGLYSSFTNSIFEIRNTRRPAVYGIIRADYLSFPSEYFLRHRFPSGTHLNHVRSDEHSVEALPVGRNLRLLPDSVNYTSNALNQYSQVASTNFSYDGNDNLSDDGTNDYTYDESNRLLQAQNSSHTATYEYDAFNRRVSKTVDSVTTYYVYDANEVIEEYNSSNVLQADYVMGSRIDEPLTMTRSSTTYYYHLDGLGNIRQITNSSGVTQESYDYDPYGNTTIYNSSGSPISSSAIGNRFMFTGREFDEESGIYHYRNRAYSPTIGRFLQRDPIGYADSMNLYEYVNSNPTNFIDPSGEFLQSLFWITLILLLVIPADNANAPTGGVCPLKGKAGPDEYVIAIAIAMLIYGGYYRPHIPNPDQPPEEKTERIPTDKLRKDWEDQYGKPWPTDENGKPYVAHHKEPLGDGGTNDPSNIEPMKPKEHIQYHKDRGDFKRWGGRRGGLKKE